MEPAKQCNLKRQYFTCVQSTFVDRLTLILVIIREQQLKFGTLYFVLEQLAIIRFSCAYGYHKMLMPDEGSQLMKGCKEMQLYF